MIELGAAIDAAPCLAIDIGASKVDVALVDGAGVVHARQRVTVEGAGDRLIDEIEAASRRATGEGSAALVGVACAGPMTFDGEAVSPLNIPAWRDFPLRSELTRRLGAEVHVEGDARALALAEGYYGAGRDDRCFLSMVVSTGIGGGLVLDGRLIDGRTGNAGHVGHLTVVPNGRACGCGARGCLEAEASGLAIERMTGRPPNEATREVRERVGQLVGRAVATLAAVLDFDRCYVAGSVALGYGDDFFATANDAAREVAAISYASTVELRPTGLDADGPLLGASLVARRGAAR
jgi:glucokinase